MFLYFTFKRWFENQLKSLLTKSIHNWKQFTNEFYNAFHDYSYDELYGELQDLRRGQDESFEYFFLKFRNICYRFPLIVKPSQIGLFQLFLHLNSLSF